VVNVPEKLEFNPEAYVKDIASIVRHPIMQKVYEMYDKISEAIREYLNGQGFLEYPSPIIGPVTDPGIRGAKQATIDYYGREYKIMSSAILYKQLLSIGRKLSGKPGKIYFFAYNVRLEPVETANTDRHLSQFIQVDLEIADANHFDAMEVAEGLLLHVIKRMKEYESELKDIWEFFKPYLEARGLKPRSELKIPEKPFKKYTHKEAVKFLEDYIKEHPEVLKDMEKMFGYKPKKLSYDAEIPWEYEWLISYLHDEPFFIHDYPKGSRGFYDKEYTDKPGILMDFDMLFPEGYGEAASGAAREYELRKVIARMKETGESIEKYEWYLKFLQKYGSQTAGFGIGLERTVRYICGLPSIYLAIPYPKIPGIYSP
jgi:asparaginyl-tRNA synthetase